MLDRLARAGRRALAGDLPGFGTCDRLNDSEPILTQQRRFAAAALDWLAPDGGAVVCGNSLGGCLALLLAQDDEHDLSGVVPVAPAGLEMARWFALINREPVLRTLLSAPVPVPSRVLQTVVGGIYKRLAFHRPGKSTRSWPGPLPRTFATAPPPRACWPPAGGCFPSCATA